MPNKSNINFDEFRWLENYVGNSIELKSFCNISNFVFFWSLFESKVCGNQANVENICNAVDKSLKDKQIKCENYNKFYEYFKNRYTQSGKVNSTFDGLDFRPNDKKVFVQKILEKENTNLNRIIKALLLIVYRLRNNLFHGKKRMETLNSQIDNFKIVNELLAQAIEDLEQP